VNWRSCLSKLAAGLIVLGGSACLLIEAPADVPALPAFRPFIRHAEVVPAASRVLTAFPERFLVPVDLVDPTVTIQWRAYIDFEPVRGEGLVARGTSGREQNLPAGAGRLLSIAVPTPLDLDRCHTVSILVANRFVGNITGVTAHLPEPPGGDSISWLVNPSGDPQGCPQVVIDVPLDAGTDADASMDAAPSARVAP
jgi:hypothetical protein